MASSLPLLPAMAGSLFSGSDAAAATTRSRVRPGDAAWPTEAQWNDLARKVDNRLLKVRPPFADCAAAPDSEACAKLFKALKNPYFLGDEVGLTQTLGWVGAWTSQPSAYAVAARNTRDVVAAVNFAREHDLRLVVKGGGHSYQGTSNAADSLLVWTRPMNRIALHDAFVGQGCEGQAAPQRAVTVEAGAMWGQVYDAVTTRAGGYVQGGGCLTVGVAGLIQSGGFGSFSKGFGLASASLLQAEIVTADGVARTVNACKDPELFWGLKGGGGGNLGVVTRVTLRVHALPQNFGIASMAIRASSTPAYGRLIALMLGVYAENLHNPHWGEQIRLRPDNTLKIDMVFQGLTRGEAQAAWQPLLDAIDRSPQDFRFDSAPVIMALSARDFWAPSRMKKLLGFMRSDDRPDAPEGNVFWAGDQGQAGQVLHGFESAWLPAALLREDGRQRLVDALLAASRHWGLSLHVNKGLAGASAETLRAAGDTAMNPAVLDAFALMITGAEGPPAYPGVAGHEPDPRAARPRAQAVASVMDALRKVVPDAGSYVSESNYFNAGWRQAFWGSNYPRLRAVKKRYDPEGLFFTHHGVGSEDWSADGFRRLVG